MKKLLVSLLVVLVGASIAWLKRDDILLAVIKYQSANEYDVAENRTIPWQQGPAEAVTRDGEQPPNIILIVADDLGFNDISTFGGGVADGKLKTPNIDRLAAEGAVFHQSYSGASTCAPSRAMMMTGRYPTRTGFEFTPTPSGMGKVVARLTDSLDNNMPPSFYNEALEAGQPPYEQKGLPASEVTIAEMLKAQGYYTAHVGKWHLGRDNGMAPHQQGFDDSLLMASGLYLPEDDPNVGSSPAVTSPITGPTNLSRSSKPIRTDHSSSIWLTGGPTRRCRLPAKITKR